MLALVPSTRFRNDVKRAEKRGKDMTKLRTVLTLLANEISLPPEYRDHSLRGDWIGFRDLHIEPDWLLLYRIADDEVQLARTGSHSDLFREWPQVCPVATTVAKPPPEAMMGSSPREPLRARRSLGVQQHPYHSFLFPSPLRAPLARCCQSGCNLSTCAAPAPHRCG
ncbi:type II toxin-antitoxin system YafQ family toxin [Paracoccus jiaweipingae]